VRLFQLFANTTFTVILYWSSLLRYLRLTMSSAHCRKCWSIMFRSMHSFKCVMSFNVDVTKHLWFDSQGDVSSTLSHSFRNCRRQFSVPFVRVLLCSPSYHSGNNFVFTFQLRYQLRRLIV